MRPNHHFATRLYNYIRAKNLNYTDVSRQIKSMGISPIVDATTVSKYANFKNAKYWQNVKYESLKRWLNNAKTLDDIHSATNNLTMENSDDAQLKINVQDMPKANNNEHKKVMGVMIRAKLINAILISALLTDVEK